MPWGTLNPIWNIHFPTIHDLEAGVKSLHDKFWRPEHGEIKEALLGYKKRFLAYITERNRMERLGIDDSVSVLKGLGGGER